MILSVATARAMTIADAHPAPWAGYFRRVASVSTNLIINVTPATVAIAVVFLGTITVAATIIVWAAVLNAICRSNLATGHRWEAVFLAIIVLAMIFACYGTAIWLSHMKVWQILGPLVLFLGLLTLLNALRLVLPRPDQGAASPRAGTRWLVALRSGAVGRYSRGFHHRGSRPHYGGRGPGFRRAHGSRRRYSRPAIGSTFRRHRGTPDRAGILVALCSSFRP